MSDDDPKALEREFDFLMARAGIEVPADRRAGALSSYRELKALTELLRGPRSAAAEPSNIFSLPVIVRSA